MLGTLSLKAGFYFLRPKQWLIKVNVDSLKMVLCDATLKLSPLLHSFSSFIIY